ncbi:MAG: S8 family serine peptidase, partial [Candidatus Cloacimonadaceae bacterium]|nr:S8 family serine peptidase [Candidatus Cloacimonadaceae bacterium]
MRTLITLVVVLFCLQLWAQVPDTTSVAPGRLIIKVNQSFQTIGTRSDGIIETDQTWFNNLAVQYQIDMLRQMYVGSTRAYQQNKYLICFPDSIDLETVVSSFDLQSSVQDVRYDFYVHLCTDDPFNSYQWNMQRIKANDSYYTLAGSIQAPQAVRIAVVDTGIDFNHPDLTNNILRDNNNNVIGYNALSQINDTMDDNGHGTLVAGVIAARTNNNVGISSLVTGNNVKLMPIKAFNRFQQGWVSDVCSGIDWAIDNGAQIINCSWVTYQDNQYVPFEIQDIISGNPGVLFVAARGPINDIVTYPAFWARDFDNLLAVGGSDYNNFMSYNGIDPVIGDESIMTVCAPSGTSIQDPLWSAHDLQRGVLSILPILNPSAPYQMHHSIEDPRYTIFQFGD